MYLRRIVLRDWKAYVEARFEFPAPTPRKNVILIGAPNGFGKTSLFEAMVLGLFGRDGLPLIARAPFSGVDEGRLQVSYNDFLSGALHQRALREGRSSASVELAFDDEEEGPIVLRRLWYFSSSGQHRQQDEEVRIFVGPDERPLAPPPLAEDKAEWIRSFIARRFLPYYLAAFFLFDGEQVRAFAERNMSAQVRIGIEGLLGIPVLRALADDLKRYADTRRYSVGGASDETFRRVNGEIQMIETQETEGKKKLDLILPQLEALKLRREALTRELGGYGSGTEALLRERLEDLNRHRNAVKECFSHLHELLSGDFAMALAGERRRKAVIDRLASEDIRDRWEAGRAEVQRGLDGFLNAFSNAMHSIKPDLTEEQRGSVLQKVREVWVNIGHPPPDGCAPRMRHMYLRSGDRAQARERLVETEAVSVEAVLGVLHELHDNETKADRLQTEINEMQGAAPRIDELVKESRTINEQIDRLTSEHGSLAREQTALQGQLASKRQELARLAEGRDRAAPALRRAARATTVSDMIDKIISEAIPGEIDAVAVAMSDAYLAMARKKGLVKRIEIDSECNVQLLTNSGSDVRDMDLSAGEQQIFTLALISAISKVSGRDFPTVVDTPLGRLDVEHREGVLKYFTARPSQVILLSTDTEVVGQYHDLISNRVLKTYRIEHDIDGDVGRSRPVEGYFVGELA